MTLRFYAAFFVLATALVACPLPNVAPTANADQAETLNTSSVPINVSSNDVAGTGSLDLATIDLNPNLDGVQTSFDDATKGKFSVDAAGNVTFAPKAGTSGPVQANYTIKNTVGLESGVATITVTVSKPPTPFKVLFIGNSRTRYNTTGNMCTASSNATYDIPEMLKTLATGEARSLDVTTVTTCGRTLLEHYNAGPATTAGTARAYVKLGGWTHVVLQAATDEVTAGPNSLQATVAKFNTDIKAVGAQTVLYENWWFKGDSANMPTITSTMETIAQNLGIKLVPVGRAWKQSGLTESVLFNNDGEFKHATPLGAYTAASAFYSFFYNKAAPASPVPAGVTGDTAKARNGAKLAFDALGPGFKIQ